MRPKSDKNSTKNLDSVKNDNDHQTKASIKPQSINFKLPTKLYLLEKLVATNETSE